MPNTAKPPRPAVTLHCLRCENAWRSTAGDGMTVRCPRCNHSRRVPTGSVRTFPGLVVGLRTGQRSTPRPAPHPAGELSSCLPGASGPVQPPRKPRNRSGTAQLIRKWAAEHGVTLAAVGALPYHAITAYNAGDPTLLGPLIRPPSPAPAAVAAPDGPDAPAPPVRRRRGTRDRVRPDSRPTAKANRLAARAVEEQAHVEWEARQVAGGGLADIAAALVRSWGAPPAQRATPAPTPAHYPAPQQTHVATIAPQIVVTDRFTCSWAAGRRCGIAATMRTADGVGFCGSHGPAVNAQPIGGM